MPTLTLVPNQSLQDGTWTKTGGTVMHTILSDGLNTTYVQNSNKCRLPTQVARLGIQDVSLPAGAKIYSVGVRITVERVSGSTFNPQPLCLIFFVQRVIFAALTVNIPKLFQILFGFKCPRPEPTVAWVTQDLASYLEQPAGGEWTQESFNDFEVQLGRDNTGANLKISQIYVDVNYNERPVGTAILPTGTIVDTTRPLVQHTYTDPEGDAQQAFRYRIFSQAQYSAVGFDPEKSASYADSGWVKSEELAWTVDRDLVNGNYRAYVMVEQVWNGIGVHRSPWSFTSWTQNVPGPPDPVTTATYEPVTNRVRLTAAKGGSSPATETINFEYSDDTGVTWEAVRGATQVAVDGAGNVEIFDYEAPLNRTRRYRALAFRTLGSIKVSSGYSNEPTVVPESLDFWLKDPLVPALNAPLPLSDDQPSRPRSQGVFKPLVADDADVDANYAVAVTGPEYGLEGKYEWIFTDDETWEKFRALAKPGRTLLHQYPNGEQHYVALGKDLSWKWDMIDAGVRYRRASVSYVEVSKP